MIVSVNELVKKPTEIQLCENGEFIINGIQTSTYGYDTFYQKIRIVDTAICSFKIETENNKVFWFDKKWKINIIKKL